jgi:hypothetical protein
MPLSRRHHVLPRFYLERFANAIPVLTQVWLPGDRSHPISVNDATVINDYYNITDNDGAVDDFWERQFSVPEGAAAEAFREVVDERRWPPSDESRRAIADWVALQYLRSSSVRDSMADQNALVIKMQTGTSGIERLRTIMQNGLGRTVSDSELEAEWEDLTQVGGTHLLVPAAAHIKLLTKLIEPTSHMLYDSGWGIVRFDRKRLITSDSPVSLRANPDASPFLGVGLATAATYMVALSRVDGLVIVVGDAGDYAQNGTTRLAQLFNFDTANNARKYLLHHPDDADMLSNIPLHEPVDREIRDEGNEHFVDREGWAAKFRRNNTPSLGNTGTGHPIPHYTWPIPGRRFENPHSPPIAAD